MTTGQENSQPPISVGLEADLRKFGIDVSALEQLGFSE